MYISYNGNLLASKEAFIPPNEGFQYGYGLFETLKVHTGKVYFIDEHLKRLNSSCKELNIGLHYDLKLIKKYIEDLMISNHIVSGVVKIIYAKNKDSYDLLITTRQNMYNKERYEKGFMVSFATTRKNQYAKLTYIKSNNYLENILAKQEALQNGYDEAIFLNVDGILSEGTCTNIFFVKEKTIYTPSISCGILPGIMRKKVIDLINILGLPLKIGTFQKEDLFHANEIFLTNSLMDIMPVSKLNNKIFNLDQCPITTLLIEKFHDYHYTAL
ncbi:aminotransferase class IV [Crassaminicella profunda]|uniref:aminotransferase class IV n=1 Tax=Crassaminicella profunda TaxID=1286698 RepID=UPI001CA632A3|nr:aminotransferase class IV [Crassaminicella profunda]QZY54812.1 aminotransferase class IV [Crassaminicella profunda]